MAGQAVIQGYTIFRDTENTAGSGGLDQIYPGGIVLPFIGAVVLNLGDVVFLSADNTVNKSVLPADHLNVLGVVVGGDLMKSEIGGTRLQFGVTPVNTLVGGAGVGVNVMVQVHGAQYVVCDAATPIGPIAPSIIVAGRVRAATVTSVAAGAVAVTSTAANGNILAGDGVNKVIGRLLQAAAAAGDIRLALIR